MVYFAYAIQPLWKTPTPRMVSSSGCRFFIVVEIIHNDWSRIRLNNHCDKIKQDWSKPEWYAIEK
jgi:hypothetical protein